MSTLFHLCFTICQLDSLSTLELLCAQGCAHHTATPYMSVLLAPQCVEGMLRTTKRKGLFPVEDGI